MTMAYLSVPNDRTNFFHILSKPDDFCGATPYTDWFAAHGINGRRSTGQF
jgi:hypothetical protein